MGSCICLKFVDSATQMFEVGFLNAQLASLQSLVEDHFKHLCGRVNKLETDAAAFNVQQSRKPHANLMTKVRKLEENLMGIQTKVDKAALPQPMPLTTPSLPLPPCAPH